MPESKWSQPTQQRHLRNGERGSIEAHLKKAVPTNISFVFSLSLQPSDYDPLSVNMGSLTVYRFTLRCKCNRNALQTDSKTGKLQKCGQFMPFDQQGWPSYAGITQASLEVELFLWVGLNTYYKSGNIFAGIRGDSYFNYKARMKQRMAPKKKKG